MAQPSFPQIVELIVEIRDDLASENITEESLVFNDLGIDSLDLIQLSRLLRKRFGVELYVDEWHWKIEPLGTIVQHLHEL